MIVTLAENALDPYTWQTHHAVDDLNAFLRERFDRMPDTARFYLDCVSSQTDITPHTETEVEALFALDGHIYIIIYPAGIETILLIVVAVIAAVAVGVLLRPNTAKPTDQGSANNALSNRSNEARPNQRIPDIYAQLRAFPDEIAPPYRIFEANQEVEYSNLCIGRGSYEIEETVSTALVDPVNVWDIKEDATPVQEIAGESLAVYGPNSSANQAIFTSPAQAAATLVIGEAFVEPVWTVKPSASVNGQILTPPNNTNVKSSFAATYSGTIVGSDTNIDLTNYFQVGQTIYWDQTAASGSGSSEVLNLAGSYVILSLTSQTLTLANPSEVNSAWNELNAFTGEESNSQTSNITLYGNQYVGPFIVNEPTMTQLWLNFVAPQGLYKISGSSGTQYSLTDNISVGIQAIDGNNQPIGEELFYTATIVGSAKVTSQRGCTLKIILPLAGSLQVRCLRTSYFDDTWEGTNADQIQWRDLYAVSPPTMPHFGNVTTIQVKAYATASALTIKQRKLNVLVNRLIPTKVNSSDLMPTTSHLTASQNAADIVCAIAKDPYIGNRTDAEIDYATIYSVLGPGGEVETYFGTSLCTQFAYTYDDSNISFEEMLGDIAQACFCQFYRQGSLLTVYFEKQIDTAVLLFNHRNKLPGSETRTTLWGYQDDYDGIEIDYIDPNAPNYPDIDTTVTLYFPTDQSAINAKKITLVGVRNNVQAALVGARLYNKLLYQNTLTEFKATKEAALLVLSNRILVADNTRDDTFDGQIIAQNVLELTLSQPVTLGTSTTYKIFLQHKDGTVESIGVTQGTAANKVVLATAPAQPLLIDPTTFVQATTYLIALPNQPRTSAFLVTEKQFEDNQTYSLKAMNYDDRYYANDLDFINGILTWNGTSYNGNGGYGSSGSGSGGTGTGSGSGGSGTGGSPTEPPVPSPINRQHLSE